MSDTCRNFDALIARAAQLTPNEAAKLEAHLASCDSCRELARAFEPVNDSALAATGTPETKVERLATRSSATDVLRAGGELGKYRLERLLGRGGMGEVWAALDPDLDRRVAVKLLRGALTNSVEGLARLQREGRAMARLRHPNVITVYDAAFADGRGLIAMELIDGESFASWLDRAHPRAEVVDMLLAAGRGLAAAHDAGLLHRDFKPHNVLVERSGRVLVTDFGLARAIGPSAPPQLPDVTGSPAVTTDAMATTINPALAPRSEAPDIADTAVGAMTVAPDGASTPSARDNRGSGSLDSDLTQAGSVLGTPAYMAPEQLLGHATNARCDQFAFCVTAWEALTGARPFPGTDEGALLDAIEGHEVVNEARVPRRLRAILHRGLASDPAARWPSMATLLRAFERAWRRPRRIAIASGAIVAFGAVAAAFAIVRQPGEPTCADEGAAIREQWSPTVATQLRSKMVATGAPHAERMHGGVAATYARYTAAWTSMRMSACSARREGDAAAARTLACLDVRRTALASNIAEVMTAAGAGKLAGIPNASTSLEPIATCAHPTDVTGRFDDAARVRKAISDAEDRYWNTGERQEAGRALDRLASELATLGYPPLRAEVLVAAASLADLDHDFAGAEAALRQAVALAEGGDDRIKIKAAIKWASVLIESRQVDEAKRMLDSAEASLAGFGIDIGLDARLARTRGLLASAQDSLDEAARHYERAVELERQVDLDTSAGPELVDVYTRLGRTADAQALKSRIEAEGSANVVVDAADRAHEQCEHAEQNGELEEAIARCSEAVALEERKFGADASFVALRRMTLGRVLALHGDHAKARAQYLAAVASAEKRQAKDGLMYGLLVAGKESLALDDAPAAIDQFRRSADIARELGKSGEEVRLVARAGLGRALAAAQQDTEAITELEWAVPRLESLPVPRGLSTTRFALAEALWRRNGRYDRPRARLLAVAAREFAIAQNVALKDSDDPDALRAIQAKEIDEVIARIDRWLSRRRRNPRN
jgi:serine/threonine protein kinase/predicted negative regulator of RcsB-dependent stress response